MWGVFDPKNNVKNMGHNWNDFLQNIALLLFGKTSENWQFDAQAGKFKIKIVDFLPKNDIFF